MLFHCHKMLSEGFTYVLRGIVDRLRRDKSVFQISYWVCQSSEEISLATSSSTSEYSSIGGAGTSVIGVAGSRGVAVRSTRYSDQIVNEYESLMADNDAGIPEKCQDSLCRSSFDIACHSFARIFVTSPRLNCGICFTLSFRCA